MKTVGVKEVDSTRVYKFRRENQSKQRLSQKIGSRKCIYVLGIDGDERFDGVEDDFWLVLSLLPTKFVIRELEVLIWDLATSGTSDGQDLFMRYSSIYQL